MAAVICSTVDLTPQQVHAIGQLRPIRDRLVEQWKTYGGSRVTTKTYVRCGTGKNQREWLVLRSGRAIPNPTPGKGTPNG